MSGFDVIGDVHGYAGRLEGLLQQLGYRKRVGVWCHPDRTAIFVGDLIDRGPEQLETVLLVRAMADAGAARLVMGNHEFNAIAYATRAPDGSYCRSHSGHHDDQHRAFLDAVGGFGTTEHLAIIDWFRSIPLWLELDGLRVVHACWSRPHLDVLGAALDGSALTAEIVLEATREGTDLYDAIEVVLKGPEVDLEPAWYPDKEGVRRDRARLRWWDPTAHTLRSGALIPPGTSIHDASDVIDELPDRELRSDEVAPYGDATPVLFGHYWWQRGRGEPAIRPTTGCLDFSVAAGGDLAAYRWDDGDMILDESRLVFA